MVPCYLVDKGRSTDDDAVTMTKMITSTVTITRGANIYNKSRSNFKWKLRTKVNDYNKHIKNNYDNNY